MVVIDTQSENTSEALIPNPCLPGYGMDFKHLYHFGVEEHFDTQIFIHDSSTFSARKGLP